MRWNGHGLDARKIADLSVNQWVLVFSDRLLKDDMVNGDACFMIFLVVGIPLKVW